MPQQTKTFRVFVSSTFTDMREERRILQRDVFPELEKFCETKGAKFQGVDLRWGVNEDSALNQKTLQICFNEIARCQKISPKPNFLILLGDKYGWQPIPEIIPEDEMMAILEVLEPTEKTFIEKWYRRDDNAIPPDYVLQPKGDKLKEYSIWEPVEAKIRISLRDAVKKLNFSPEQWIKYFSSATHQEIIRGALDPATKSQEHVLAFTRTINNRPQDKSAKDFIDISGDNPDEYCKSQLANLKLQLSTSLGVNCRNYTTDWKNNQSVMSEDAQKEFRDKVLKFLKNIIENQINSTIDPDEITHEMNLHGEFKNRLTEHFKGREAIIGKIQNYLTDKSEKRVLSLIGASGSGKSSVMAQAVELSEPKQSVLVYRFIGTSSRSSNIMSLLQSLCGQIAKEFGVEAKTLAREGEDKAWYDMNGLADIFKKCLAMATAEKPVLVFLDALDQLSDTDNAKALYWLPRELPNHARLVISSLPELESYLNAAAIEKLDILPEPEAIVILDKWFGAIKRKLTIEQKNLIVQRFRKTKMPIYLKLAFEKGKYWHSYDQPHTIREDVAGIINDYFIDLENEHDKDFVRNAVCYLLSGRYQGLAENEILEILAFDTEYWKLFLEKNKYHKDDLIALKTDLEGTNREKGGYMKIPIAVWSRLYLDLEPFLTERDADGVPIITFFHRQFNEVLRERYDLPNPEVQSQN